MGFTQNPSNFLLGLVWSVIQSSLQCGVVLCSWTGHWKSEPVRRVMMEAGTAACSCVSPSGCCQVTRVRSAPSPAPDAARNLPRAGWSCSHHQICTENTDQTLFCRNIWRTGSEHVAEKCPCSVLMTGQNQHNRTVSPCCLLLET